MGFDTPRITRTVHQPHFLHTDSARLPQVMRSRRYEESGIPPPHTRRSDGRVLLLPRPNRRAGAGRHDPAVQPGRHRRHGQCDRHARSRRDRRSRHAGLGRRAGAECRLQLDRPQGTGHREARPSADRDADRAAVGERAARRGGRRAAEGVAGRRGAEAGTGAAAERAQPDPSHRARDGGGQRRIGKGAGQGLGSQPHPGACPAAQPARQSRLHDDYRAHRRHRHLA